VGQGTRQSTAAPFAGAPSISLEGCWRATPSTEPLRRAYPSRRFEDDDWAAVTVPGHWQRSAGLGSTFGPVLFRRRFELDPGSAAPLARWWLELDGVMESADVWFDGTYLGDVDTYFQAHAFEVTDAIRSGTEHLVAMEVRCDNPGRLRRAGTGSLFPPAAGDPDRSPGGIWRPVRVRATGPVRLVDCRLLPDLEPASGTGRLRCRAWLDAASPESVTLRTEVRSAEGRLVAEDVRIRRLGAGRTRTAWTIDVPAVEAWWPRNLGRASTYLVSVEVRTAGTASPSDRVSVTTGFRSVRLAGLGLRVNGESVPIQGAETLPIRLELAEVTPADVEWLIDHAEACELNLLRLRSHVSVPELYEAADRRGLLLWQDLPFEGGLRPSARAPLSRAGRAAVTTLGHHPSVALWCAHKDPFAVPRGLLGPDLTRRRDRARWSLGQFLPGLNRTLLDGAAHRALSAADPTRPALGHSGVSATPLPPGSTLHSLHGWWHPRHGLERAIRLWPRRCRLVEGLVPPVLPPAVGRALDEAEAGERAELARRSRVEAPVLARVAPRRADEPLVAWAKRLEQRQAAVLRSHLDLLRLLEGRPVKGFVVASLNEPLGGPPASGDALVDASGTPRAAYHALGEAARPLAAVARLAPPSRRPDPGRSAIELWVVSRLGRAIREASVLVDAVTTSGRTERATLVGSVEPRPVTWVGTVTLGTPSETDPLERVAVTLSVQAGSAFPPQEIVSHYDAATLDVAAVPSELDGRGAPR